MKDRCIIIIDPQKDFISEDGAYAKRHPELNGIRSAATNIQELINTKTGYDIIIVYSSYTPNQFGEDLSMCIPGTEGHELGITVLPENIILSKKQHSAFTDPLFSACIEKKNYRQIMLCGFLAEYCVMQTAIDGLKKGYRISLLEDCIATGDDVKDRMTGMIELLQQQGATILNSPQL